MTTNLSRDEQLRGRQIVRHALRDFTSELLVFYNPKLNMEEMNDLYDRPLDIVLLHKTKGLLGIVIKGGEIVEESGDLVSQYQPSKQYYKIIDPLKQAQKAMTSLLDGCDPTFKEFVPITVAVAFPDTLKSEFTRNNPLFIFSDDLGMDNLQSHIEDIFTESWDAQKTQKYWANVNRIKEFLKLRSDNNIERVERKETLSKLGVKTDKPAYQLPQKQAPGAAKKPARQGSNNGAVQRQGSKPVKAPPMKAGLPPLPPQNVQPRRRVDLSMDHAHAEARWREEQRGTLSGGQWGMMIAIAAIIICVAYFVGRNAGIVIHLH